MKKLFKKLCAVLLLSCSLRAKIDDVARAQMQYYAACELISNRIDLLSDYRSFANIDESKKRSLAINHAGLMDHMIYAGELIVKQLEGSPVFDMFIQECKAAGENELTHYFKNAFEFFNVDRTLNEKELISMGAFYNTILTGRSWHSAISKSQHNGISFKLKSLCTKLLSHGVAETTDACKKIASQIYELEAATSEKAKSCLSSMRNSLKPLIAIFSHLHGVLKHDQLPEESLQEVVEMLRDLQQEMYKVRLAEQEEAMKHVTLE